MEAAATIVKTPVVYVHIVMMGGGGDRVGHASDRGLVVPVSKLPGRSIQGLQQAIRKWYKESATRTWQGTPDFMYDDPEDAHSNDYPSVVYQKLEPWAVRLIQYDDVLAATGYVPSKTEQLVRILRVRSPSIVVD
jgi:hypothetical protein